jgi:hypothetical protein
LQEQSLLVWRRLQLHASYQFHLTAFLLVYISLDRLCGNVARSTHIVSTRPQVRQTAFEVRKFFFQLMRRVPLQPVHDLVGSHRRRERTKEVNVIGHDRQVQYFAAKLASLFPDHFFKARGKPIYQNLTPELWYPHEMIVDVVCAVACSFAIHKRIIEHLFSLRKLAGMQEVMRRFPTP